MKKNKLKTLKVTLKLKGNGLVNFNGSTPTEYQNKRYYSYLKDSTGKINNNTMFAKEHVYKIKSTDNEGNEKIDYKVNKIISSNLLRKPILGNENDPSAKILLDNDTLRLRYHSQLTQLARGWALIKDKTSFKRKSGVTVTDAEQTCDAISTMQSCTKEGERDATSFFYKENVGHIEYSSDIYFDVKQLQFLSIDDNYDRMAIKEADVENYLEYIRQQGYSGEQGVFATTHDNLIGEQGIVFCDKLVYDTIRKVLENALKLRINRANSTAYCSNLYVYLDNKQHEIKSIEDFDALNLEFGCEFHRKDNVN